MGPGFSGRMQTGTGENPLPDTTTQYATVAQKNQEELIHQEVQTLVDKGVIVEVPPTQVDEGFY